MKLLNRRNRPWHVPPSFSHHVIDILEIDAQCVFFPPSIIDKGWILAAEIAMDVEILLSCKAYNNEISMYVW